MTSEPFRSGAKAYFAEVPRRWNPWNEKDNPVHRDEWFRGWDETQDEVENTGDTVQARRG